MKKILYALAALVVLLVAVAVLVPMFVDEEQIKAEIAAQVKSATGRELLIDGDIEITLFPTPGARVGGVRFANLEGASAPHMVTLREVAVSVALAPLLGGEVQVKSVRLVEPVIALEVLADGRVNWAFGAPGDKAREAGAPASGDGARGGGDAIKIDSFVIENGTLIYRDAANGTHERIEGLNAELSAGSLRGPFSAKGEVAARTLPLAFDISVGRLDGEHGIPLQVVLRLEEAKAEIRFSGAASGASADATLRGELALEAANLARLVRVGSAATGSPVEAPPMLARAFSLKAKVAASAAEAALNDIELVLGEVRASGAVNVALGRSPRFDATLALNRIDLDAWLAGMEPPAPKSNAGASGGAERAQAAPFALPGDIAGSLAVGVEAVSYRGNVIRQLQLSAALADGRLELTKAAALLPGSSDVSLTGALVSDAGKPLFDGRLEAASDNLRSLLGWLGVDVEGVPADRLHKLSLTSALRVTPELAQVYGIDLRLDTSRLAGAAAFAFRQRPSFSLDLTINRFNLDAYLPAETKAPSKTGASPKSGKRRSAKETPATALAFLDDFDTNVKVRVDKLTANARQVSGLTIDASLIGGVLTVRGLTVENFAGASAAISATAGRFASKPTFKANLDVRASDAGRLISALSGTSRSAALKLGAGGVRGSIGGDLEKLDLDVVITAARAKIKLAGALAKVTTAPRFDFRVDAKHPSLVKLSRDAGLELEPLRGSDGPVAVAGRVKGDLGALELDLAIKAAGADVKLAGNLADAAGAPRFDFRVDAKHPSLVKLAGIAGMELGAAGGTDSAIAVAGRVNGNLRALKLDLAVKAAGADVKLAGDVSQITKAPHFNLRLAAAHPSLIKLAANLGTKFGGVRGGADGPVEITGRVAGTLEKIKLDGLSVSAAGAKLDIKGELRSANALSYDFALKAGHADFPAFMRTLGVDYRPAAANLGGFNLSASVTGSATSAKLASLEGHLGPVNLAGSMAARWDRERPRLKGSLRTSEIILDLFLPVATAAPVPAPAPRGATGATAGAGGAGERWSRAAIDVSWLDDFDADLELASRGIVFQGYAFGKPTVSIKLKNGVLDIDPLSAKLFDGDVRLNARVQGGKRLTLGLGVAMSNGDLFKALTQAARVDTVSGRFGFEGRFQTSGRSQLELVSSLTGKATLNARDGFVRGLDLRALSDRLGHLNSAVDFLGLIQTSMNRGQTRLLSLDGRFDVARGVATTNDTRLVLDGGDGLTVGTIDLPRWFIDTRTRFQLSDHPKAPPFGVDLAGPLDAPRRTLRTAELQQFVAMRVGGAVIRKTLEQKAGGGGLLGGLLGGILGGGGQQPQTQETQPQQQQQTEPQQQQPAPTSPTEQLIRGLEGIFGRK